MCLQHIALFLFVLYLQSRWVCKKNRIGKCTKERVKPLHVHLVYGEDYVEQLKEILEAAGHKSCPVLLIDGNLTNPSLKAKFGYNGPCWEVSWLDKTTGKPPKKFYHNGNLSVWSLQGPIEVEQAIEKWGVALFHIRTPKQIVIVDGGTFPPPEGVDLNVLIVDRESTVKPDPKMVCISPRGICRDDSLR